MACQTQSAGRVRVVEGLMAETPVATPQGWRAAGLLQPGDLVLGAAHPPQPLLHSHPARLSGDQPEPFWPVHLPAGVLDNRTALLLLPQQPLLIDLCLAADLYGDPCQMIPAAALVGWRGILRRPMPDGQGVVRLIFAAPQVIYASRGVLIACPGVARADPRLSLAQAQHLIACAAAEDLGLALRCWSGQAAV